MALFDHRPEEAVMESVTRLDCAGRRRSPPRSHESHHPENECDRAGVRAERSLLGEGESRKGPTDPDKPRGALAESARAPRPAAAG